MSGQKGKNILNVLFKREVTGQGVEIPWNLEALQLKKKMGKGIFWGKQNEGYPEHPNYSFSEYWDQAPWHQILMRHWVEGEDPVCDVRWFFGQKPAPQERVWGEPGVDCRVCNWDVPTESWGNTCDFYNKRSASPINFWAN